MSSNKSNKWKKVGGRSRSANYNAVRIPQQTANIFNISDLMGKASTDNSTLGKINIHDNVAIQGTLDVSGSASGITSTKTSGKEFATLDWVNSEFNPANTLWSLHDNGNIIFNKTGTQVDIIGNTYNEGTSTFNGSLQVTSPFVKETSFFGLTNDTEDQSQPPNFGSSVAISNMIDSSYNIAVTSAQQAEVYYTDPSGDSGTLGAKIDKNNDISFNNDTMGFVDSNQSIAISADGKIVVVGDPSNNRIFISTTTTDGSVKTVIRKHGQDDSQYGYSVAISSDGYYIAVGAPNVKDGNGVEVGKVFMWNNGEFSTDDSNGDSVWLLSYEIINDWNSSTNSNIIPHMGISVAFNKNGRLLAIGSAMIDTDTNTNNNELINNHTHDQGKSDQYKGQVDVYKASGNSSSRSWHKLPQSLTVDNYSHFGKSISISDDGTILAVGAPGQITAGVLHSGEAGNVYIYQIDGITASQIEDINYQSVSNVTWKQIKTIPGKPHSSFGTSVSLNLAGDTLVAGGPTYDGSVNGTGMGYAEVYTQVFSDWRLGCPTIYQEFPNDGHTYIPNTSAYFGSSVSISSNDSSNNMIVVGAPYNQLVTDGNSSVSDENYGTIFTYALNDIVQSNLFSVDGGSKTTSFKGNVYIDRTGITGDPSGNEVVTADWVRNNYGNGNGNSGLTYTNDDTVIKSLSDELTNTQQLLSQQNETINNIKSSLQQNTDDITAGSNLYTTALEQLFKNEIDSDYHHNYNKIMLDIHYDTIEAHSKQLNNLGHVVETDKTNNISNIVKIQSHDKQLKNLVRVVDEEKIHNVSNDVKIHSHDKQLKNLVRVVDEEKIHNVSNDVKIQSHDKQLKNLVRVVDEEKSNLKDHVHNMMLQNNATQEHMFNNEMKYSNIHKSHETQIANLTHVVDEEKSNLKDHVHNTMLQNKATQEHMFNNEMKYSNIHKSHDTQIANLTHVVDEEKSNLKDHVHNMMLQNKLTEEHIFNKDIDTDDRLTHIQAIIDNHKKELAYMSLKTKVIGDHIFSTDIDTDDRLTDIQAIIDNHKKELTYMSLKTKALENHIFDSEINK